MTALIVSMCMYVEVDKEDRDKKRAKARQTDGKTDRSEMYNRKRMMVETTHNSIIKPERGQPASKIHSSIFI